MKEHVEINMEGNILHSNWKTTSNLNEIYLFYPTLRNKLFSGLNFSSLIDDYLTPCKVSSSKGWTKSGCLFSSFSSFNRYS